MPRPQPPRKSLTGEQALNDLRSLWPVPTFVLAAVTLFYIYSDRFPSTYRSYWLWAALVLFVVVSAAINRRALTLAQALHTRGMEASAARDRMVALNAVARALAEDLDLPRTVETICEQTAIALGMPRSALALRDERGGEAVYAAFGAVPEEYAPGTETLSAPIAGIGAEPLGRLYVDPSPGQEVDASQQEMLAAIAAQSGLAIRNARLFEDTRRHADDLTTLARRVAEAVASSDDIERIAVLVSEQALRLLECDGVTVLLLSEDRQTLTPIAGRRSDGEEMRIGTEPLPVAEDPLFEIALSSSAPAVFPDARTLGEAAWTRTRARALIACPLRGHNQGTLGLLIAQWHDLPRLFDDEEVGLAGSLAGFAAVAIENARFAAQSRRVQQDLSERNAKLLEETQRRGRELRALVSRVGDALAAGLSSERVAELVAEQARQMIPCHEAVFSIREDLSGGEGGEFRALAAAGEYDGAADPFEWRVRDYPFLQGVMGRANPIVIADVAEDGRLSDRERASLRREGVAAMLIAPLRGRGDRVLGLLSLFWRDRPYTPTGEEFEIIKVLAAQAAAALENARLYSDLEVAEVRLKEQLATAMSARDFVERILENVQAAVLVLSADSDYYIQRANALAEQMPDSDLEQDGLVGRRLADVFPGLEAILETALWRATALGESSRLEEVEYEGFQRGTTFWTISLTPQRDPVTRRVAQIIVLALETTERIQLLRQIERNALREQQRANELDATLRSLGDGVLLCDGEGRLLSVNRAGQLILGSDVAEGEPLEAWADRIGLRYPSGQRVPPGAIPLARVLRTAEASEREEYLVSTAYGEERVLELDATPVRAAGGRGPSALSGVVAVFRDITALKASRRGEEAANRRVEILVGISRRLNATLDPEEIHEIVTDGALDLLPGVEDVRALLYAYGGEGGAMTLLASRPEDRGRRRPRSQRDQMPFTIPFDANSPVLWQLYVQRLSVVSRDLERDQRFNGELDQALLRGPGEPSRPPRSAVVLPLLARDTISGHLVITSSRPSVFDDARLIDALTNLAALAVIARVNAGLYTQTKQRAEELNALWSVGQAIASKLELTDVVDTLTDRVRAVMAGEVCTLSLFETDREGVRRLRLQGRAYQEWAFGGGRELSHGDPCDAVGTQAAVRGETAQLVGLPNPTYGACRWRAFAGQSGSHSVIAVPLKFGADSLGALTVYRHGEDAFSPEEIRLLENLASLAVAAVRNAQIYAYEQNIAETLQKAFLPGVKTEMPGLEIAEKYYATRTEEARIGGDYFDFLRLAPDRLAVIIGDISGKGLAAAVYTAMAKYTLRAFALQGASPAEVVTRANLVLSRETTGEIFSTLFYGVFDLTAGTLTYVNAGHEPPQLAHSDGTVEALEPTGFMMGAFPEAEFDSAMVPFRPGDVVALYTDGLPDARAEDGGFYGEAGIRQDLIAARAGSAEQIADTLHQSAVAYAADRRLRDDIALLVIKGIGE